MCTKGTPEFIAAEASGRLYDYLPQEDDDDSEDEDNGKGTEESRSKERSKGRIPFFHNDLHDLESLLWIVIWVLFTNYPGSDSGGACHDDKERDKHREHAFSVIFPSNDLRRDRRLFLQNKDDFYRRTAWMPDRYRTIRVVLNTLRRSLVRRYFRFEATFPDLQCEALDEAHIDFLNHLGKCSELAIGVILTPYVPISHRSRTGTVEDSGQGRINMVLHAQSASPVAESRPCGGGPAEHGPDGVTNRDRCGLVATDSNLPAELRRRSKRKRDDDDDGVRPIRPFNVPR